MKLKALGVFKSKFFKFKLKPCRKVLVLFKLRLKKLVFIRALHNNTKSQNLFNSKPMSSSPSFLSILFRSPKKSKDNTSASDQCFTSSGSPSVNKVNYVMPPESKIYASPAQDYGREEEEEVEEACRRFEKYLVEMIVEEGKTMDLMDVEELLHCWKKLKSPVFIDLVSRFYGELCRDLFSSSHSH